VLPCRCPSLPSDCRVVNVEAMARKQVTAGGSGSRPGPPAGGKAAGTEPAEVAGEGGAGDGCVR